MLAAVHMISLAEMKYEVELWYTEISHQLASTDIGWSKNEEPKYFGRRNIEY